MEVVGPDVCVHVFGFVRHRLPLASQYRGLAHGNRLEIYSYWNQGGLENVLSMFLALGDRYLLAPGVAPTPGTLRETPPLGLFHPMAGRYFSTPRDYLTWYEGKQKEALTLEEGDRGQGVAPPGSPKVAVLLYRKHVITGQGYISQMIR